MARTNAMGVIVFVEATKGFVSSRYLMEKVSSNGSGLCGVPRKIWFSLIKGKRSSMGRQRVVAGLGSGYWFVWVPSCGTRCGQMGPLGRIRVVTEGGCGRAPSLPSTLHTLTVLRWLEVPTMCRTVLVLYSCKPAQVLRNVCTLADKTSPLNCIGSTNPLHTLPYREDTVQAQSSDVMNVNTHCVNAPTPLRAQPTRTATSYALVPLRGIVTHFISSQLSRDSSPFSRPCPDSL
jgi:hypothetical protein